MEMNFTDIEVGPTVYSPRSILVVSSYVSDGSIALLLLDKETGERNAVATVNVDFRLRDGEIALKSWSENEGMIEAFDSEGLLELDRRSVPLNFVEVDVVKPSGALKDALDRINGGT